MEKSNIEVIYEWLDETAIYLQEKNDDPYIECLIPAFHMLDDKESAEVPDDLEPLDITEYSTNDIRKGIQLALLKGMKDSTQQNHLMTPETVALMVAYLARKLIHNKENVRIFDIVCGTGNLLTHVFDELGEGTEAYGSEVDPILIQLAAASANMLKYPIHFFHQDSLQPFLLDPVDIVIGDLPVGYYPENETASEFDMHSEEELSYAHHLLMEQGLNYTKTGGYGIFIIPALLFESEQSDILRSYIHQHANIIGVLQLPETAFASEKNLKSILILQKKDATIPAPKQPLLVKLPSFKDAAATEDILNQMDAWFADYLGNGES